MLNKLFEELVCFAQRESVWAEMKDHACVNVGLLLRNEEYSDNANYRPVSFAHLMRVAAYYDPSHAGEARRVLSIDTKASLAFLSRIHSRIQLIFSHCDAFLLSCPEIDRLGQYWETPVAFPLDARDYDGISFSCA